MSRTNPENICRNCRFWEVCYDDDGNPIDATTGECRKNVPIIVVIHTGWHDHLHAPTSFPETDESEWCGEFTGI